MTSRRTLLLGAIGAFTGARLLSACADAESATEPSNGATSNSNVTSTSMSIPTPEPSSTSTSTSTSVPSGPPAWAGADFASLDSFLERPLVPSAPTSMVAAWGKDDQKLYIVPDSRLVVARLGGRAVPESQAARSPFDVDLWDRLVALRG